MAMMVASSLLLLFHVQLLPQGRAQRPDWGDQVEGRDENGVSTWCDGQGTFDFLCPLQAEGQIHIGSSTYLYSLHVIVPDISYSFLTSQIIKISKCRCVAVYRRPAFGAGSRESTTRSPQLRLVMMATVITTLITALITFLRVRFRSWKSAFFGTYFSTFYSAFTTNSAFKVLNKVL